MIRIVSIVTFALVSILSCTGCGSSSRTAEQKQKAPVNEVAEVKPVAAPIPQDTPVLGVSAPYQVGTPKGGCKMIVIYDRDGSVRNVASCDSDKNGNVVAVRPIKFSPNAAEMFLQP